jgi:hypothetical protein
MKIRRSAKTIRRNPELSQTGSLEKKYKKSSQKRTRFLIGIGRLRGGPSEGHGTFAKEKGKNKFNGHDRYRNL